MNEPEPAAIGHVVYHHRTQGKAVEGVHIRGIVDALRAEGIGVEVVSPPGADPYATPAAMSPTRQARRWMRWVTRLPEPLFELAELGWNLPAAWRLRAALRRHPETGLVYERYALFLAAAGFLCRRRGIPLVLEINDAAFVERVRPLFFRRLAAAIERRAWRRADGLVFVSEVFRQRALAEYGTLAPSIVSPNAANLADFTPAPGQRETSRARLGIGADDVVCGYLGAFVPWHGIDRFIERIAPRLDEAPGLKLLLVGDGATFVAVQARVEQLGLGARILLPGRVAHGEVGALLAAMDLAVLPSAGDYTSPVKLFEFMAAGIAPVAPDFAPVREIVVEDANGWLFPAGDLDAAVEAVLARSRDREGLARVGRGARDYIAGGRQWRDNITQLLEFVAALRQRG